MKLLGQIPKCHFHVACSGGSDSMVLVDFLLKYPKNDFDLLYFNHGTKCCDEAESFVRGFAVANGLALSVGKISRPRQDGESLEEYWRNERYSFLGRFSAEPILMAHHLNDVIETWTMTCMQGRPSVIPYYNEKYNIRRPLLCVPKAEIEEWAVRHGVKSVYDASNSDTSLRRNYVRHNMMDGIYRISPGIEKIMIRKVMDAFALRMEDSGEIGIL